MKNLRRRLQKLSARSIILLALAPLLVCVVLNARPSFDLYWIFLTGGGALVLTFFILAPMLLPIADTLEEKSGAYRIFFNHIPGHLLHRRLSRTLSLLLGFLLLGLLGRNLLLGFPDPVGGLPGLFSGLLLILLGLLSGPLSLTLVRDGKVVSTAGAAPARGKPDEEDESSGRCVIVTDSTSVVVLRTDTTISRIVGPGTGRDQVLSGVIFTEWDEEIDTIVDLRPQLRLTLPPFQATTNDGITIEARVLAILSLKRTQSRRMRDLVKEPVRWPPPFIWHAYPIWQGLATRRMQGKDDKPQRTGWSDSVLTMAVPQLRQIIARYTVDYLTAPLGQSRHPRFGICGELMQYVRQRLDPPPDDPDELNRPTGIDVYAMAVPLMWPPKKILLQRIESWKNEWRSRTDEIDGRAEAEAIRTRELTRAQVQGEMTARINDALREARASGTGNLDLITLRFLEAMENMAKDPTTRALLTLDSLKILQQLRDMLAPGGP